MRHRLNFFGWVGALALVGLTVACGSSGFKEDPLLALSAEESLAEGKALMEEGKYRLAEDYLSHAFEVEPNSASGREALLLSADSLFLAGGEQNYIRAEAKYRDFQNRFPTSERGDYVLFQIANSLANRMNKPDRDQTTTRRALEAYQQLVSIYPDGPYAEEARQQIELVRQNLAESEVMVGRFYLRTGLVRAAIARLETVLEQHPDYAAMDRVLWMLGSAQRKAGQTLEAQATFDRLRAEYPESEFLKEIPRIKPEDLEAALAAAAEAERAEEEAAETEAAADGEDSQAAEGDGGRDGG